MNGHWAICRPPGALAPHLNKFMGNSFHDLIKYVYCASWTNTFCYLDRNTIEWGKACGWPRRAIWRARLLMEVDQSETAALFGILTRPLSGRHQIDTFIDVLNDPEVMWFRAKYVWKSTSSGLMKACAAPPTHCLLPATAAPLGSLMRLVLAAANIYTYTQIRIHMCIHKYIYTCVYVHKYIHTCVCIYINTYTPVYMYTDTYTHVYTQIHIHT